MNKSSFIKLCVATVVAPVVSRIRGWSEGERLNRAGGEVAEVYVGEPHPMVPRP